jgi:hypothetical protein
MGPEAHGRGRLLLLVALLAAAAGLKLLANPSPTGVRTGDGHYYYEVARHVAEGQGLLTSVSIFHQGLHPLPAKTNVQPLWPLLLGLAGRAIGLERAAWLLPELLYLCALALLHPLANRMAAAFGSPVVRLPGLPPVVTVGHLAVCILATSPAFFRFTSLPHTEGLAFTLVFASLLALDRVRGEHGVRWAAAAGALAALAYLTRLSLASVPLGVVASLVLAAPGWRVRRKASAAASGAALLVCLPWWAFLASFVDPFHPAVLIHFASHRATPALAPLEWMVSAETWTGYLRDRGTGVLVAFDPRHAFSYARSFGASTYAVLVVAALASARLVRSPASLRALRDEAHVTVRAALLGASGALLLTHLAHQRIANEWLFHWRPGLPMILLVVPALGFLLARVGVSRAVALLLGALSLLGAPARIAPELRWRNPPPSVQERALFAWIDTQQPPPTFLAAPGRPLSVYTRGRFHDLYCHDAPDQVRAYFRELHIDYLVVYARKDGCRFLEGLGADLEPVREFGRGRGAIRVYRPRASLLGRPPSRRDGPGGPAASP